MKGKYFLFFFFGVREGIYRILTVFFKISFFIFNRCSCFRFFVCEEFVFFRVLVGKWIYRFGVLEEIFIIFRWTGFLVFRL